MRITRVTTKKGDDGTTSLAGGERVSKDSPRITAVGTVDELNAALGLALAYLKQTSLIPTGLPETEKESFLADLSELQNLLFTLGCDLSLKPENRRETTPTILPGHVTDLEKKIDSVLEKIPPLVDFVLPTGTPPVAALHLARTVCRRAERETVTLSKIEPIGADLIPFLNRLSDYLFVLARRLAIASGEEERTWKPVNPG